MFEVRELDEAGKGIMARSEIALLGQMARDCALRKDPDPTARYRAKKSKIVGWRTKSRKWRRERN
jgi:hypothetical protein